MVTRSKKVDSDVFEVFFSPLVKVDSSSSDIFLLGARVGVCGYQRG